MRHALALSVLAATAAVAAVSCSSDGQPGAPPDSGGASGSPSGTSGASAAGEAGLAGTGRMGNPSAGDTGSGGGAGEAAGGQSGSTDTPGGAANGGEAPMASDGPFTGMDPFPCGSDQTIEPDFSAVCSPTTTWGTGVQVMSGASPGARLVGVTPDVLTLVWSEGVSSETWYYVVDRSSSAGAYGAKAQILARNVIGLSPDGLRVVALSGAQDALHVLSRPDRASAFGSEAEGELALLNADAHSKGWSFSSCVFAPDDRTLYYTVGAVDERYPLHVSTRSGTGAWPVGEAIQSCELEAHSGYARYPTGVSSDGQTLFFYDSWRGKARAGWRTADSGPFTWFKDLGDLFVPQPNAACDHLYYSAADPASPILAAPAQ